jgi:hypothetical protein
VSNQPNFVEPEEVEPVAPPPGVVRVPAMAQQDVSTVSRAKRVFANAHAYHINSISVNSDDETFLSADDLRVNLWNLGVNDQSFNIVDIKPPTMEELTEVITAARFHPTHCNIFMYSSSKGAINICDMRAAALCDAHAKSFEEPADTANRSVMCYYSSARFNFSAFSRDVFGRATMCGVFPSRTLESHFVCVCLSPSPLSPDVPFVTSRIPYGGGSQALSSPPLSDFFLTGY